MTIYVIANQKGGVGKTTLSVNLAVALSKRGTTVLVDADDQESAFKWNHRREQDKIETHKIRGNLMKSLETLKAKFDYVVLDVAGRDSEEFRSALIVASKLIIPTQPSQTDLEVIPFVLKMINKAREINPKLQPYVVLNKAPANTRSTEVEAAHEALSGIPNIKTLSTIIRDRKQFRDAMIEGQSVLEMGSSKAKDEFNEFLVEIL